MDEYIKREDLLELYRIDDPVLNENGHVPLPVIRQNIMDIPAADVAPVRHGRWVDAYPDIEPNPMFMYGICSECEFEQGISKYLNYCPNCGAKMDGGYRAV